MWIWSFFSLCRINKIGDYYSIFIGSFPSKFSIEIRCIYINAVIKNMLESDAEQSEAMRSQHVFRVHTFLCLRWNVWINYEHLDADTEKSASDLIRGDKIRINKETS